MTTVTRAGATRRGARKGGPQDQARAVNYLWLLPAFVISVAVIYFCVGYTAWISLLNWDGISPDPVFIGIKNFTRMAADPVFWDALQHTVIFFVVTFVGQAFLGFVFAVLLHSKLRFAVLYKIIIFVPVVIAPATMAPIFRVMYTPTGQVNNLLANIGLGFLQQPWLGQSNTALLVILSIAIWSGTGISFILYFAAMGQIEQEIIEAARLDGAGSLRVLTSIIWPNLRGTTVAIAMLTAIGSLKLFDIPQLVTAGGPNYATEFLGTLIYRQSVPLNAVGYASALSMTLLVLAVGAAILLRLTGRERGERRA
ncbi:MAG TPA: sugar ABC transporter permease [Galbitalea sp.]|jgi:raffinose/stachyose/melibiose transport system permease protein